MLDGAASGLRWVGLRVLLVTVVWMSVCGGVSVAVPLPDGRAWEMVSPLDKNGGDITGIDVISGVGVVQSSADGSRVTYVSNNSFGEPQGAALGSQYVSERSSGGWVTQNISTPLNAGSYGLSSGPPYYAFAEDLSSGLVFGGPPDFVRGGSDNPPLAGAPAGYSNYYVREIPGLGGSASGRLESVLSSAPSQSASLFYLEFEGATPDLEHIVVTSEAVLAAGAEEVPLKARNLYEWDRATGRFETINILPGGGPAREHLVGLGGVSESGITDHAISRDGSSVVWTGSSGLYVREGMGTPQAKTVLLSVNGQFRTASADGSKVFFTEPEGELLEYEAATEKTIDLSLGVRVAGVAGVSEDGSYVYYVDGSFGLYLWHDGETKFIARLSPGDESREGLERSVIGVAYDWSSQEGRRTTRVTPDGTHLLFMSQEPLTGYDNTVATGASCGVDAHERPLPAACQEVFLYDASSGSLRCVSCNPSGARPIGPSGIPGGTEFTTNSAVHQSRVLSEDGSRVFFNTADALVPQDTDNAQDVYEYENGHVYLLSGGTSAGGLSYSQTGAAFVDASANGDDVFFVTRAQLVPQDTDDLVDLYDARAPHVPGEAVGFPAPAPASCEGEDCRVAGPPAPVFTSPSSVTYTGTGNVSPAAPVIVVTHRIKKKARVRARRKARRGRKARAGRVNRAAKAKRGG